MVVRLSDVPVIVSWSTRQDGGERDYDSPSCHGTDENEGGDAKYTDWKDATVKHEN